MDLRLLLLILIIIVAVLLIISVTKKLIKFALIAALIVIIVFAVTGGSIMGDYDNLKDKLSSDPQLAILMQESQVIAGFIDGNTGTVLSQKELDEIEGSIAKSDYPKIKGDSYKLFIFKTEIFDDFEKIKINNKEVTGNEIGDFFENGKLISKITKEDLLLDTNIPSTIDITQIMFSYLYNNHLKPTKSPVKFFKNYKEGTIIVYPESMFFKFTKIIPLSWVDGKLNKLKGSLINKTKEVVD